MKYFFNKLAPLRIALFVALESLYFFNELLILFNFKSNDQLIAVPMKRAVASEQHHSHNRFNILIALES